MVRGIGDVKLKKLLKRWPTKPKLKSASMEELMEELKIKEETARELMAVIAELQ
jgi:ERCC4-type nuclease